MKEYHCLHAQASEKNIPDDTTAEHLSEFFKVFADSTRLKILYALLDTELCVHDLALTLGMQQSAISHQLRYLRHNRLVKVRKEGKSSHYSLDDNHILSVLTKGIEHIKH